MTAAQPERREQQGTAQCHAAAFQKVLRGGRFSIADIDGDEEFEVVGMARAPAKREADAKHEVDAVQRKAKRPSVQPAAAGPDARHRAAVLDSDGASKGGLGGAPQRGPDVASSAPPRPEAPDGSDGAPGGPLDAEARDVVAARPSSGGAAPQRTSEVPQRGSDDGARSLTEAPGATPARSSRGSTASAAGLERRELVQDRLKEALGGDDLAAKLARRAEGELFRVLHLGTQYNRQVRSVLFNLRGDAGLEFRGALRAGAVPAEALASLPSEEMASSAKRAEREQLRREAMEACEADWELRHDTVPLNGTFTCGKCSGNRTWYFQFQTRACDEPMEFFVMCRDCHHGWRHNDVSPDDIFRQVWS